MSLHYVCDGCGAIGTPRGRSQALPEHWQSDITGQGKDCRLIDLCLACTKARAKTKETR